MTDRTLILVGSYPDRDVDAFGEAFAPHPVSHPSRIEELPAGLRERARAVALKGHHPFDGAVMDRLPALELIANYGVGIDAIDLEAARERGIRVTNTPDVLDDDVADLAVAMWLAEARGLVNADRFVRAGDWTHGAFPLRRAVTGRRVGILGLGRIGREIAGRLAAFKTRIHYYSRTEKATPGWTFHDTPRALAAAVDDLFVSVVGGVATEGLVDAAVLDALGPDGTLVNVSRGSVVDEAALIDALASGRLRGAGLDVFRGEPHVDPALTAMPNVVLQPHIGTGTIEVRAAMGDLQRRNIAALFDGTPFPTPVI